MLQYFLHYHKLKSSEHKTMISLCEEDEQGKVTLDSGCANTCINSQS